VTARKSRFRATKNSRLQVMPSSQKKWPLPEGAAIFERLFV
jgi:hypothetical protein